MYLAIEKSKKVRYEIYRYVRFMSLASSGNENPKTSTIIQMHSRLFRIAGIRQYKYPTMYPSPFSELSKDI